MVNAERLPVTMKIVHWALLYFGEVGEQTMVIILREHVQFANTNIIVDMLIRAIIRIILA